MMPTAAGAVPSPAAPEEPPYAILFPVLDDWEALARLLPLIDGELHDAGITADVICIDDGSTVAAPAALLDPSRRALRSAELVTLRGNFGHQRAIAIGLCHVATAHHYRAVIVMDADGEDLPADVPRLIRRFLRGGERVVFAQRTRRSEGLTFTAGYHAYRVLHRVLTGIAVEVGNFSLIPQGLLHRLIATSDLWNHCAAAIIHTRLPAEMMPTRRGERLAGRSAMNYQALVRHGLSAMSVFSDRIGVRLLAVTASLLVTLVLAAVVSTVAGWWVLLPRGAAALTVAGLLFLALAALVLFTFVMNVLRARGNSGFVPVRDFAYYIDSVRTLS
jgi:polyisoprenyl-phosphate glycosyltransferase